MLVQALMRDVGSFTVLRLTHSIVQQAATFLLTAPPHVRLRSLDALHIASAQAAFARARRGGLTVGSFVTSDRALLDAPAWVGLHVLNPEDYP